MVLLVTERRTEPLVFCKAGKSLSLRCSTPGPLAAAGEGSATAVASQGLPKSEEDAAPNQRIFTKLRRVIPGSWQVNHSLDKRFNDESPILVYANTRGSRKAGLCSQTALAELVIIG